MNTETMIDNEEFLAIVADIRSGRRVDGDELDGLREYVRGTTLERDQLLDALLAGHRELQIRLDFRRDAFDRMVTQIRSLQERLLEETRKKEASK